MSEETNDRDVNNQYMDDASVKCSDIINKYSEDSDSDESSDHSVWDYNPNDPDIEGLLQLEKEIAHPTLKHYETQLIEKENRYMEYYHLVKEKEQAYMRSKHRLCHLQTIYLTLFDGWQHSSQFTPEEYRAIQQHVDDMEQKVDLLVETQRLEMQALQNKLRECTLTEQENDTLFRITALRREYFNAI